MKKLVSISLFLSLVCATSFGQVMQKKMTQSKPTITAVPVVKPAPVAKTVVVAKPNVVLNKQIVFLNTNNPVYKQKILNPALAKIVANHVAPLVAYSKIVSFPDNTKLHINLIKSPKFAGQSANVNPIVKSSNTSSDNKMDCTTSVVSLSATSTDFLNNGYSQQTTHIYPGAIYTYDNLYNGSFKEETQNRNPIFIGSDNPNMTGNIYEEVATPNMFTIDNAIAKLYQRFTGTSANESTAYQIFESSNSSDFGLKVGVGASGYGISFSNVFSTQNQQQHYYLTIDARKTLFSMSSSVPDSGFFKTPVNSSSPYVVMGNVSYGVRILANLDFTFSSQEEKDNLKAAYSGYGVSAKVDLDLLSKNTSLSTKINAYIVGGPSSGTTIAFDKDQLKTQLQNILSNATYANARPISYQLYDMEGSVIGASSATDQFTVRTCIPSDLSKVLQTPFATIVTGSASGDNKDRDTHYSFGLFDQNNRSIAAFHDDSNTDEYAEGSSHSVKMIPTLIKAVPPTFITASIADFANGGHLHINVAPNGNDTWKISQFTLNLTFANDLHSPHQITWPNITMSQNSRDLDLYFDNGFHAR
jgi:hypothetical protein